MTKFCFYFRGLVQHMQNSNYDIVDLRTESHEHQTNNPDRIQHPFIIKAQKKQEKQNKKLQYNKKLHDKLTGQIILNREKQSFPHLNLEPTTFSK